MPKPNTDKFRLIQDLSFPRGDPSLPSVNASIVSDDFPTEWGTFAEASALILELPAGCRAATFDIKAAYRMTPVIPLQQNAVCIMWDGKIYVDRALMFGLASSAGVFGSVADLLVAIYRASGFAPVIKWVDDFLVIQRPGQSWSEDDFIDLTGSFGVPWALDKTRPLASQQRYIGFVWDLESKTVALPAEKLKGVQSLIADWLGPRFRANEHEAAKLHARFRALEQSYTHRKPCCRTFAGSAACWTSCPPNSHFSAQHLSTSAGGAMPARHLA